MGGRARSRRGLWLGALLLLVAIVGAAGALVWPRAREYARHGVQVTLEDVVVTERTNRSLLGRVGDALGTAGAAASGGRLRVRLLVRNATFVPVWVRSARYRARAHGHVLGQGRWQAPVGARLFWPGHEVRIESTLDSDLSGMLGTGLDALLRRDTTVSATGELEAGVPPLWMSVPFEVSRVGVSGPK